MEYSTPVSVNVGSNTCLIFIRQDDTLSLQTVGSMYGLTGREFRFSLVIGSSHFTQHVFFRVLPPLIPVLAVALHYPLWQLGLLISLHSLGMGVAQAPIGYLADRYDRRFLLPTGLALAGSAYVLFAFAPSVGGPIPAITLLGYTFAGGFVVMSLSMVVMGIGVAACHPVCYPMISDNVSDENKGKALGIFGAASKLGDATTPAIVAVLILILGWQEIILLFGIGGILYGVALFWALAGDEFETIPTGVRQATTVEEKNDNPTPTDRRSYLYPMVTMYCFFTAYLLPSHGIGTFLPAFIVAVYAISFDVGGLTIAAESIANLYFALLLVAGALMQLYLGKLTDLYDARSILLACMGIAAIGLALLAVVDLHPLLLIIVIVILGTGLYGNNPARDAIISNISPPEREGRTFGYFWTAATLTGAAFPTLIGYLLEVAGMRVGFLILAFGAVLAGGFTALLYSERVYLDSHEEVIPTKPTN